MDFRAVLITIVLLAGCAGPGGRSDPAVQDVLTDAIVTPLDVQLVPDAAQPAGHWAPGLYQVLLAVGGEQASGLLMVPTGTPTALVVVAHGWGGDAAMHRPDLEALAKDGAAAIAMDYRGERGAYKVAAGVEDTMAATRFLQQAYPEVDLTLLYGWSMGGEVVLLAAQQMPAGTYDYVFAGAGVSDLERMWETNPGLQSAIEAETGGRPDQVPDEYARRSPVLHPEALAAAQVARVFLVHAAGDSTVPVDQSERMAQALTNAGQAVSLYVVTKDRVEGPCVPPVPCLSPIILPANHEAGAYRLMAPFMEHRIERAPDPVEPSVRGTYDGDTGDYDPSDVG